VQRVIAVGDLFGISGRRAELHALLAASQQDAVGSPGCRRYDFAATLPDPDHVVLISEWDNQAALDQHYRSAAFDAFQFALEGMLARPSEMTVHSIAESVRPTDTRPMDPRDAD
jgi:quinol monooxygenase YgiN